MEFELLLVLESDGKLELFSAECQEQGECKTSARVKINDLSLAQFKRLLRHYYTSALWTCYNVEDPRTWKTICLKCNYACTLTRRVTCYFLSLFHLAFLFPILMLLIFLIFLCNCIYDIVLL